MRWSIPVLGVLTGILLTLISLYALIGFLLVPYIIKAYVIPAAADRIKSSYCGA